MYHIQDTKFLDYHPRKKIGTQNSHIKGSATRMKLNKHVYAHSWTPMLSFSNTFSSLTRSLMNELKLNIFTM
jgi:hypothetical protein